MSKVISGIYDAAASQIQSYFPLARRLPNPHALDENNSMYLKLGWALVTGRGDQSRKLLSLQMPVRRNFMVVLSRQFFALEQDAVSKASAEKALMEDQFTLLKNWMQDATLGGTASNTTFVSDSGIEYLGGKKEQYLLLRSDFEIEYFEDLTT